MRQRKRAAERAALRSGSFSRQEGAREKAIQKLAALPLRGAVLGRLAFNEIARLSRGRSNAGQSQIFRPVQARDPAKHDARHVKRVVG